ncbi:epididymal secretory glutathione peroxidase-like [Physella acuta]|uniref:epididymal secretory glutathione peroxidase-like n=1 Tax=Physella acuta TaxID=109671 RepID=UPI0027DB538F|nr:epididymal secretory glutathione peroxidase-like [Physella acuta]
MNALLGHHATKLTVLAIPCDQFGHQEPGANATEILNGLHFVRPGGGFTPHRDLQLMAKADVNGANQMPLYTFLKDACPPPSAGVFNPRESFWQPIKISDLVWNFEKFILSPTGVPLFRFRPEVEPLDIEEVLTALFEPVVDLTAQRRRLSRLLQDVDQRVMARAGSSR